MTEDGLLYLQEDEDLVCRVFHVAKDSNGTQAELQPTTTDVQTMKLFRALTNIGEHLLGQLNEQEMFNVLAEAISAEWKTGLKVAKG